MHAAGSDAAAGARARGGERAREFHIVARANSVRKGGHLLLSAIATWGETWLRSLGGADIRITVLGALDRSLDQRLAESKVPARIRFVHGNVPHAAVGDLYRGADLFVMPSLSESLSLACLEALAYGLPLVVTPYTGMEDIEGQCGFFIHDTVDSVGAGILEAIESRDRFEAMGRRGQELVQSLYNWPRYRASISNTMSECLA